MQAGDKLGGLELYSTTYVLHMKSGWWRVHLQEEKSNDSIGSCWVLLALSILCIRTMKPQSASSPSPPYWDMGETATSFHALYFHYFIVYRKNCMKALALTSLRHPLQCFLSGKLWPLFFFLIWTSSRMHLSSLCHDTVAIEWLLLYTAWPGYILKVSRFVP